MFEGATESTIAAELGISAHTVHTHIDRIHKKLEVGDRVGLVMQIIREFVAVTLDPEGGLPSICARRAHGECPFGA